MRQQFQCVHGLRNQLRLSRHEYGGNIRYCTLWGRVQQPVAENRKEMLPRIFFICNHEKPLINSLLFWAYCKCLFYLRELETKNPTVVVVVYGKLHVQPRHSCCSSPASRSGPFCSLPAAWGCPGQSSGLSCS